MNSLKEQSAGVYILSQTGGMLVPGLVVASEKLLSEMDIERPLQQVANVAHLKGIVNYSIAMPDIHWGYGFPIGGVAAMDADAGVISPGGVGYDINCGVRLAVAPVAYSSLSATQQTQLLQRLYTLIPSGVGHTHKGEGLSQSDYSRLLESGAQWSVGHGFGFARDLDHSESHGVIAGADATAVSDSAKHRGRNQLGTIGSGNHFVEIGEVETLYLPEVAETWGVQQGQAYILIHSGSRGLGHQVCQDTLDQFLGLGFAEGLPDRQLVAAPIRSEPGQRYFQAMAAAANYAFNNRQQILHYVRKAWQQVCHIPPEEIRMIYDVCHNIAKFETHEVAGVKRRLCVHRKGATRAYGPGAEELAPIFQATGQPVLVPGDMGRASHLMVGCGNPLTWCSACHGAGRARSRVQSEKAWKGRDPLRYMESQNVRIMASSSRTITEEMPDAYKNVDDVVEAVQRAGLAKRVARLRPRLVLKG